MTVGVDLDLLSRDVEAEGRDSVPRGEIPAKVSEVTLSNVAAICRRAVSTVRFRG
jgi:hypothetical protein